MYAEPFAGSLAVLLAAPSPAAREIVCDTDGLLCNFWRAIKTAPDETAYWADYPTIHQDLTARHGHLIAWREEAAARLSEDPDFCDPKMAGWWVWGLSSWIGGGWCRDLGTGAPPDTPDQIPCMDSPLAGQGVQRRGIPDLLDQIPAIDSRGGGQGVRVQRLNVPRTHNDQMPRISSLGGGRGVQKQRRSLPAPFVQRPRHAGQPSPQAQAGRLTGWFDLLSRRLETVVVLNRSWQAALTPTVLADTATSPKVARCILLDPPYLTTKRDETIYSSDYQGSSDETARAAYAWAVEHGGDYRIAYCCHEGDFEIPSGWEALEMDFAKSKNRAGTRDQILFSPACYKRAPKQRSLV